MNVFQSLGTWVMGGLRRRVGVQYPTPQGYSETSAAPVTFDSAMQLSAVWACVKLIAETVASLPVTVWQLDGEDRRVAELHPLTLLMRGMVNRYQTRIEFFETLLLNLITSGNAYVLVERSGERITSLLPLMSAMVDTRMLDDGSVVYEYTDDRGVAVYAAQSIWHLKLMGNGIVGLSPLAFQRNTLGIAQAAEGAVGKVYRNGAKPSGVLSLDRFLTPEQRDQIRRSFNTLTVSADERLMVLEGGMKFDAISLSPQDIELLESRKFQIAEICRWYGVPSVMVNDNAGSTVWGSGIEQIVAGFYKLTLRPLLEKIEASMAAHLLPAGERGRIEIEFDFDALLRADMKSRYESYRVGIASGLITPNEARAWEHLPAQEGGDKLLIQGAMVPVDQAGPNGGQEARMAELAAEFKSQPVINVSVATPAMTVHLPEIKTGETVVHVDAPVVNLPAPQVKVDVQPADVRFEPVVNVAAPEVKVDVAAPDVSVEAVLPPPEVNVNLPPRKTESKVEYDAAGRVTRTTQIETDL